MDFFPRILKGHWIPKVSVLRWLLIVNSILTEVSLLGGSMLGNIPVGSARLNAAVDYP